MHVALGAHVRSSDGQDVGHIDKLILHTGRNTVTAVVLRKGLLLHRDIQVPLTELREEQGGELRSTYSADVFHDMPAYAPPGVRRADADSRSAQVETMLAQYELEHAVVDEGSAVKGSAGKKVAEVHRLAFDLPSGKLTQLVVRKGILLTEDVDLPVALIAGIANDEITLSIRADEIETWARLREGLDVYANDEVSLGEIARRTATHLEVARPNRPLPLFVPLTSVARVAEDRVLLSVDSGHAALWNTPPDTDATTGMGASTG